MRWSIFIVCLGVFWISVGAEVEVRPSQVVQTNNGKIQGKTYTFENGKEASAFLGIPFGQAPIGQLRFKKPLPSLPWSGIKNTTQFASRCYFYDAYGAIPIQPSEDCLFLNVFVPGSRFGKSKPNKPLLPIIVDVHGGGYQIGDPYYFGDENVCRYLISKDVIVVSINYRLQFFGFLALDQSTSGNYGLWDMKLALEWVRQNARVFGGNPNKITVMGDSAGAMSADQLSVSPHTRSLFQKAIMCSGNNFSPLAMNSIETLREYAKKFAVSVGFKVNETWSREQETSALLTFFQTASPETITIGWLPSNESVNTILTAPSFDGYFFPKSLSQLRKEAPRKSVLVGVTEYEALLFLSNRPTDIFPTVYDYAKFYLTDYFAPTPPRINSTVADIILQTFVNMSLPVDSIEFYKQVTNVVSDFLFSYPTWKMLNIRSGQYKETTYLYELTYFDPASSFIVEPFSASTHTLESVYLIGRSNLVPSFVPNDEDLKKLETFTTAVTNFAKGVKPLNSWNPYNPKTNQYFDFGQNTDKMVSSFGSNRMKKWNNLYKRFGIEFDR